MDFPFSAGQVLIFSCSFPFCRVILILHRLPSPWAVPPSTQLSGRGDTHHSVLTQAIGRTSDRASRPDASLTARGQHPRRAHR